MTIEREMEPQQVPLPPEYEDDTRPANLRLPPFWPDTPAAWFTFAESKFRLKRVTDELEKFDHLVGALSRESLRTVLHIVENPPTENAYSVLKASLLSSHQLTNFQRIEKLHAMEALGNRKPSELFHQMVEICPRGQETNEFFVFLFLQRLPSELRILLKDAAKGDPRALAETADELWAIHGHRSPGQVAAEETDPAVAAVQSGRGRGFQKRGGQQRGAGRNTGGRGGGRKDAPRDLARAASGLCYWHWTFGDKAAVCKQPCSWTGN